MPNISAKVIEHSKYNDSEMISIEVNAPSFLDAEIEKHRMISSNSSSNRAIPLDKMLNQPPYLPKDVRLNQKGMQGENPLENYELLNFHEEIREMHNYIKNVLRTNKKIHKQHLNRYLVPFSMQTKIMTATKNEWEYFLDLRLHEAADPNIYELAEKIHIAIYSSSARDIDLGEWHLPYITENERDSIDIEVLLKISAARCARTSYKLHDGTLPSMMDDEGLFYRLVDSEPMHLSPLDHQAKPIQENSKFRVRGITRMNRDATFGSGNFNNWIQFRHFYLQGL